MTYMNHITYKIHTIKLIFEAYKKKLKKFFLHFFFLYIKITNNDYQKHKERLRKEAREKYQNLSDEEKDKRQKRTQERYQILLKKKQKKTESNNNFSEEQKKLL